MPQKTFLKTAITSALSTLLLTPVLSATEIISNSALTARADPTANGCQVTLSSGSNSNIANNAVVGANTLVNIEVSTKTVARRFSDSEHIFAFFEPNGRGGLQAQGHSILLGAHEIDECIITNVSIPGFNRGTTNIYNGYTNTVSFPNGKIKPGPLANPYSALPVLSSIFTLRMQEDLPQSYIDGIPNTIGDEDFRLVQSNNVTNYAILMREVLAGDTGIRGSSDAGYSVDFLELQSHSQINNFLLRSLVQPAIRQGVISSTLNNANFANLLRKRILADMDQDSIYAYGSDEHLKASIALQYSSRYSSYHQLDTGELLSRHLKSDYLLDEYDHVIQQFDANLKAAETAAVSEDDALDVNFAIFYLNLPLKTWDRQNPGKAGDLYLHVDPSGKAHIMEQRSSIFAAIPTYGTNDRYWNNRGPKSVDTAGIAGDIYYFENPKNGALEFFKRTEPYHGNAPPPTDKTSANGWEYLSVSLAAMDFDPAAYISPSEAFEFAQVANHYAGLQGVELAEAVLGSSGNIAIDSDAGVIYSTEKAGGLLGYNIAEIASVAFDVELDKLTRSQVNYVQAALESLLIDTLYSYGSLNNVKATILNKIAHQTMDQDLLAQIGTGTEPFILDELIADNINLTSLNFEQLVKDYIGLAFRLNGVIEDEHQMISTGAAVQLFDNRDFSGQVLALNTSAPNLSLQNFSNKMSSFIIPEGWQVEFYTGANYTGGKYTRTGSGAAPVDNGIKSVKIIRRKEVKSIELYSDTNYLGSRIDIHESVPNLSNYNFNNALASFKIPDGWEVRFHLDENYTGGFYTRTANNSGFGTLAVPYRQISSIEILDNNGYEHQEQYSEKPLQDQIYQLLVELERVQEELAHEFVVVTHEDGEPVEALPITDELFARAQLYKYGLEAEAVEALWKPYLKNGYLRNLSDARITQTHLNNERAMANAAVQDMWSRQFNAYVPIAAKYLSTVIDLRLKLADMEPIEGREASKTTLRLAYGLHVDEHIRSTHFNGIWNDWTQNPEHWLIYGPDLNYSVKTANNIFDFMAFSDVSFGDKLPYYSDQRLSPNQTRDYVLHQALDSEQAETYCNKYTFSPNWGVPISRPGALGLTDMRFECGAQYVTRHTDLTTMKDSYAFIAEAMMNHNKWDLKTVQTNRDVTYMILQMFIPIWGTVEAFQKGDELGGVTGLFGDYMFFIGTASGVKLGLKPLLSIAKKPALLVGKGVSIALKNGDEVVGAVTQVNRTAARISAKQVAKVIAKATFDELNPLSGLDDLAVGVVKKASKKFDNIRGGNKLGALSPKVYQTRTDFSLPKIDQSNVDTSTGVGMPVKDRLAFSEVADAENVVIGVRPVDEKSASLIDSGLYGSKSLLVKSKSSDWGPHSGFIPVDQKYAKASARRDVTKFNHYSQNSINTGVAVESPLAITDARLKELQGFGAVGELTYDRASGMYTARSTTDGTATTFYYQEATLSGGQKGWNVHIKEDGRLKPFTVMGSPESGKAMTADYDLFTVMHHNSDFGVENTLRSPKTWEEWKASVDYNDLSPEYKEMYNNQQLYDTKGAGTLGVISDRVKDLKNKINNQLGRGKGMEMVHHGADDANPYAVLDDNFPATFFVPKRLLTDDGLGEGLGSLGDYFPINADGTIILRNKDEFANFHQVVTNTHFTSPMNPKWGSDSLSRQARLSHVYLNARDQVAEALGAQVGNYRPYYTK